MKTLWNLIKAGQYKLLTLLYFVLAVRSSFASSLIPITTNEEINASNGTFGTFMIVLQQEVLPVVEIVGGAAALIYGLYTLFHGLSEYKKTKDFGEIKSAAFVIGVVLVVAGAVLYLLDALRTYSFGT